MAHHVAYTPRSFEGRRAFCEIARGWVEISQRIQRPVEDGMGAEGSLLIMNSVVSQSLLHLHLHVIPQHRQYWP